MQLVNRSIIQSVSKIDISDGDGLAKPNFTMKYWLSCDLWHIFTRMSQIIMTYIHTNVTDYYDICLHECHRLLWHIFTRISQTIIHMFTPAPQIILTHVYKNVTYYYDICLHEFHRL